MKYTQHPLSAAFPLMGEGDLMLMTQDIREHGLREPGVLFEGMILDGWHRYLACTKAKVDFVATEYRGDDPAGFVISKNAHRRHLKEGPRAVAVAACRKWAQVGKPGKQDSESTLAEMAAEANVSTKTMQRAKIAVAAGLGEAVRDEQMTVTEAVHVAKGTAPKPPKVEPSDEPPMVDEDDPEADEAIAREQEEIERGRAKLAAILLGDDPLSAMTKRCDELNTMNAVLNSRIAGLQREVQARMQDAKSWMRKAKALEKRAK